MVQEETIRFKISGDIVAIFKLTKGIGWDRLHEQSVYRILYLSSILYSFRYELTNNPFVEDYHFSVDAIGPYYVEIERSLIFLKTNSYIEYDNDNPQLLCLGDDFDFARIESLPNYKLKYQWLSSIIYILGIYGENRIYEFVIRDPQYKTSLLTNSVKDIDLSSENKTVNFLLGFKGDFEAALGEEASQIDNKEYLQLYFEYLFSKVVKRI